MSLEDLEKRLSVFKSGLDKKPKEKTSEKILEKVWEIEDEIEDDHRWLKKALMVGSGVSLFIIGLGLFFIFSYTSTSRDVTIEVFADSNVSRGAPFNVDISVTNNSGAPIKNAVLTLNLPQGVIAPNSSRDRNLVTENVGDIASGNLIKKTYALFPVDSVGSKETVTAVLSYAIGAGARFEVRGTQDVEIKDSAIEMEVKKPDQILSGSSFSLDVSYKNKSDFNFSNLTMEADYPNSFKFDSASVPPASLNNYWQLGSLGGKGKGEISISGHLDLGASTNVGIPIKISANIGGQDYEIAEAITALAPAASPISLQIFVNNQSNYVARAGDILNYSIQYQNSSGIALADVKIKAVLAGEMLDIGTLKADGAFDSGSQTLSWDSGNLPVLRMLDPGASGKIDFKVNTKKLFNLAHLNDRNFSVRLGVVMDSPSVPYYLSSSRTSVQAVSETKMSGLASIAAQGFFHDADSGVLNKGTVPPRVGQATQYTIHWLVRNFSTDLNNVQVNAVLASGVTWVGGVSANLGNVPTYNPGGNQVVWNIDRLAATKGILSDPAEAIFQIEATPDATMVGMPEPLIKATYLEATDNFTGFTIQSQAIPVDTTMLDDEVSAIESIVVR
ncbi:hypothetical protein D4R51_03555 [bacterium]|nr:MAG: hypothetical protein D4R51_03555 [bacterium]